MQKLNDLSRSPSPLDPDELIAVIELSLSSWLVAGIVPGVERQPLKKLAVDKSALLKLLHRWREEAAKAGHRIKRIAVAFEAGRDGFSEVVALKVSDIDSERLLLRIEQGKGRKDRFAMLSPKLLELLRDWYRIARPAVWLFPGRDPMLPMTTRQFYRVVHAAAAMTEIKSGNSRQTNRTLPLSIYFIRKSGPDLLWRLLSMIRRRAEVLSLIHQSRAGRRFHLGVPSSILSRSVTQRHSPQMIPIRR